MLRAKFKNAKQEWQHMCLIKTAHTAIVRHVKIKADATPYHSEYQDYFEQRRKKAKNRNNRVRTSVSSKIATPRTTHRQLGSQKSFIKA